MRPLIALTRAGLALGLVACGGNGPVAPPPPPPPPPVPVASVEVSRSPNPMVATQTLQLVAVVKDVAGNVLDGRSVTWATDNGAAAAVSSTGLVTAVAPGNATITATSEAKSGTTPIVVREGALIGAAGGVVLAAGGNVSVEVPPQAVGVTTPISVARLTNPPPDPKLVPGTAFDLAPAATQFSTPATLTIRFDPGVLGVGLVPGQLRLHRWTGTAWAPIEGSTVNVTTHAVAGAIGTLGTFAVLEVPVPIAVLVPNTLSLTITVGSTAQLAVTAKDAEGNVLANRAVVWSSRAPAVATVSTDGLVTAVAAGQTTIRAVSEGIAVEIGTTVVPLGTASVVQQHLLAQQGLSIALASTVLQSQLYIILMVDQGPTGTATLCTEAQGGGSYQSLPVGAAAPTKAAVYFDAACTRPYIVADVTVDPRSGDGTVIVSERASYTDVDGRPLGSMVLDETATLDFAATSVVHGLGVFTPVGGAPAVRLGLTCSISRTDESTVPCQGGVAQDFPALGTALGSVTTITLGLGTEATSPVTFTGASVLTAGSVGELTITAPTTTTLAVQGGASAGTTTASGGAAQFALFPPTPTGWSVVNPTDDLKFTIDVVSNTVRNLTATLTRISTGATLGTATLSQSGTGTISYSDGTSGAVTSWLLTK